MKILLVNPKAKGRKPIYFPLGLGYIAAVLLKNGHKVNVIDSFALNMPDEEIKSRIAGEEYDCLGITGLVTQYCEIKKISEFCNVLMGQSPPSSAYNFNGDGIPFFQGRKDFGDKYPQKTMWCSEPTRMANNGDVLLSVRAPVGDVNVSIEKCCIGRGLSAISMKNGNN